MPECTKLFFSVALLVVGAVALFVSAEAAPKAGRASPSAKPGAGAGRAYKSPTCIAMSPKGDFAYVTCHTSGTLAVIDTHQGKMVREIRVGPRPTGVAAGGDGRWVFVANTGDHTISFVDAAAGKVSATVRCGFEPTGLALTSDGKTLYSANYISDDVSVIDVAKRREIRRIKVGRAPTFLALTPDDKKLVVNNSLSDEPATNDRLSAFVSVIDTASGKVVSEKRSGGTMLMGTGITVERVGQFAFCLHARPNFNITPSQLMQGWMQTNALSIIPLADPARKVVTVLLDNVNAGAANPYGITLTKDARRLLITHRGIHKLSVIDLPRLRALLARTKPDVLAQTHVNLGFLWASGRVIRRVDCGGKGPKGLAVNPKDGSIYVANYFSDHVAVLDAKTLRVRRKIPLGKPAKWTLQREGEFLFNDGAHCFQQWLSCTSCHPGVRADGVNWDLLNDGMTNPKNAKSLVGSWQTPPVMALGVRARMEVAVEKGFLFIQFVTPSKRDVEAVSAYLRSVPYIPSPWHRKADGTLDASATRGKKVFAEAACGACHPAPLYTTMKMYDVGTRSGRDFPEHGKFDTPTLRELYRTGPYLHDGAAATLEEVLTKYNKKDLHGVTSKLTKAQIADLVAYLKSL